MVVATAASVAVGLGELFVATTGELIAYSLGSCIAICLFDTRAKVAAMAHVVLPLAPPGEVKAPGKYANTAVPALLERLAKQGVSPLRLQCKIAGGAAVLALGGGGSLPNIGQRNAEAVKAALAKVNIRVLAEDTGGNQGRTVRLDAATGRTTVRTVRGVEVPL